VRRQFLPIIMIATFALMLISMTAVGFAQPGEGGGQGPGKGPGGPGGPGGPQGQMPGNMIDMRVKMLTENLTLNQDQAAKIKTILQDEQKAAAADREKNQGDREAAMKARMARRDSTDASIKALLTKEQVVKYDKMMEDFRKNHPGGPPQGAPKDVEKATPGNTKQETSGAGK
jgi:Spy/CpxP family protein refolding chaperone